MTAPLVVWGATHLAALAIGLGVGWALVWCAVDREHEKALADIRADKEGDDAEV